MIRVFYSDNALYIDGIRQAMVAGSLVASASGNTITIQPLNLAPPLAVGDFSTFARQDGTGFASVDEAMAYLAGQFALRRSLDIPTASGIAATNFAKGTPLAVSRANGQLIAARADTYAASFVPGLANADVAAGFIANATRNSVTLSDWTSIAGVQGLASGLPYFLAPSGGMTLTAPSSSTSVCSVRLGLATSSQSFLFMQSDPVTL